MGIELPRTSASGKASLFRFARINPQGHVGRANWLHIGGDGGLGTASFLLSVCASAQRNRLDPWVYLKHVLSELPARTPAADLGDLLPDGWAKSGGETRHGAG